MKIKDIFYTTRDTLDQEDITDEWWLERFRCWRAEELKATDWTQLPDSSADAESFAVYRQALRDLPAKKNFADVELPVRPI